MNHKERVCGNTEVLLKAGKDSFLFPTHRRLTLFVECANNEQLKIRTTCKVLFMRFHRYRYKVIVQLRQKVTRAVLWTPVCWVKSREPRREKRQVCPERGRAESRGEGGVTVCQAVHTHSLSPQTVLGDRVRCADASGRPPEGKGGEHQKGAGVLLEVMLSGAFCVPGAAPRASHLVARCYLHPHFTDGETEIHSS